MEIKKATEVSTGGVPSEVQRGQSTPWRRHS